MITKSVGNKKIHGRKVDLIEVEKIRKKVKLSKGHTSAHINLPKKWEGLDVNITLITPAPFLCNGCHDAIRKEENFSPEEDLCKFCYEEKKAIDENKCIVCGGHNPKKEYWGKCEKCFNKEKEEDFD